jgi:hypothetical protein
MRLLRKRRRGATITEVATASTIFVLMLGGLVSIGMQASTGWATGTSQVMADDAASTAVQAITRDVRDGLSCAVNIGGDEVTVTLPEINAQGDYDRYTSGVQVRYYLSGGKLYRQAGVASATVLCRNVSSVRFEQTAGKIAMRITSQKQNGNRSATTTLTTEVGLRNEPI